MSGERYNRNGSFCPFRTSPVALASVDTIQPWARSFFQEQLSKQPGAPSLSFEEAAALARCAIRPNDDGHNQLLHCIVPLGTENLAVIRMFGSPPRDSSGSKTSDTGSYDAQDFG